MESEKTRTLEQKIKQNNDLILQRETKSQELTKLVDGLDEEIEGLRDEAHRVAKAAGNVKPEKMSDLDKATLMEQIKAVKDQIEANALGHKKDIQEQKDAVTELKAKLKELDQVFSSEKNAW